VTPSAQPQPRLEEALPAVESAPPQLETREFAKVTPSAQPQPRLEEALPAIASAPPQLETREFAKAAPVPAPKAAAPRPAVQPPQPAAPATNAVRQAPALATANEAVQRKAQEDYLWQVIRKLSQYRYTSTSRNDPERGLVVTRVTLARDGRLLDVSLAKSSGSTNLDRGIMEAIRRAAPFAPLPADIARDPYVFILPVNYVHER
jgi:protein TonB